MRITAAANAWRKVEGVMGDRRILRKRKGHMLNSCVTPAYMNSLADDGTYRETIREGLREKKLVKYSWELRELIREYG